MIAGLTPTLLFRIENLLKVSTLAALCEAASMETLSAEPRILLSGPFIRHLTDTILPSDIQNIDVQVLQPVANAISAIVRLGKCSSIRDVLITEILSRDFAQSSYSWAFINLAVERKQLDAALASSGPNVEKSECNQLCLKVMIDHNA